MASDNINQVGRYIKNTGKNTDFALKRYHGSIPKVERTRDIFDSEIPFEMSFNTEKKGAKVILDLNFNKPPPMNDCTPTECVSSACETFNLDVGNHQVTLSRAYHAGSVSVFIDTVPLLPEQFSEVSPANGQVYIQSESLDPYTAVVCYAYGSCPEDNDCIREHSGAYTGLSVIFADRFDKTELDGNQPFRSCGEWGFDETPNITLLGDGFGNVNETAYLDQHMIAGPQWEILTRFKFTSNSEFLILTVNSGYSVAYNSSVTIGAIFSGSNRLITVRGQAEANRTDIDSISLHAFTNNTETLNKAFTNDIEYYMRFSQITTTGYFMKVWPVEEDEPASWTVTLWNPPAPLTGGISTDNPVWRFHDIASVAVDFDHLKSITVFGTVSKGRYSTNSGASYGVSNCFPSDGALRFGHDCESQTSTITTGTGSHTTDTSVPNCDVFMSWPFFEDGPGIIASSQQNSLRWIFETTSAGDPFEEHPGLLTLEGQYRINGNGTWTGYGASVTVYQHDFSSGPPSASTLLPGTAIESLGGAFNGGWQDFSITFTPINKEVTWSVQFANFTGLAGGLPKPDNGFLFPPSSHANISFRNIKTYANGVLLCTTTTDCIETEEDIDELEGN